LDTIVGPVPGGTARAAKLCRGISFGQGIEDLSRQAA